MTRAVYVFGAAMVLLGLVVISMGVPIVRLEIGWTEVIGGSVAASAGCIVLVMGVFLSRLDSLQRVLDRLVPPASVDAEAPTVSQIADPAPIETPIFRDAHPLSPAPRPGRAAPALPGVRPEPALPASLHADEPEETAPVVDASDAPTLPESAPALVAEEDAALHGPTVPSIDAVTDPARTRPNFLTSILARRNAPVPERRRTDPAPMPDVAPLLVEPHDSQGGPAPRSPFDLSTGWDIDEPDMFAKTPRDAEVPEVDAPAIEHTASGAPAPAADQEAEPDGVASEPEPESLAAAPATEVEAAPHEPSPPPPPIPAPVATPAKPEPHPLQPVVVGRYNAGSASYVMYSNGMIEVETEQGTHQFASMQELKAFIEKRDAKVS